MIEEQEVTVQHTCIGSDTCQNIAFRLGYEGVKTTVIQADVSCHHYRTVPLIKFRS